MANEALRAEIARAIQNQTAAVTVIVQLREGGGDTELVAQLAQANAALEAALLVGDVQPPPAT